MAWFVAGYDRSWRMRQAMKDIGKDLGGTALHSDGHRGQDSYHIYCSIHTFNSLPEHSPPHKSCTSHLILVIEARMTFQKLGNGRGEVMLVSQSSSASSVMQQFLGLEWCKIEAKGQKCDTVGHCIAFISSHVPQLAGGGAML